jgi:hypothetical protein
VPGETRQLYYYLLLSFFFCNKIELRFSFLDPRTAVCAWTELTTIRVNVLENIPASSATFLRASHSCTHRLHPVSITNAKMEYAINRTVLRTTTYVNVLQGTQVFVHATSLLFIYYGTLSHIFLFAGKRCEYLTSLSFVHNTSFVELEPLRTKPEANVTVVFTTTQENGILLYDGHSEHLAVELFNGRIRVSYDVGNYPVSTMYRLVFHSKFSMFF